MQFIPGQRWLSLAEPELGLGTVLKADHRALQVLFGASGMLRNYAVQSAPLKRVLFKVGDEICLDDGSTRVIDGTDEVDGLAVYITAQGPVVETSLGDQQSINDAVNRLLDGRIDKLKQWQLRQDTLTVYSQSMASPDWGYTSARMQLLPHQLAVALKVCQDPAPRVLLADEVGLGKTIEAGLILHRLLLTGRATRALILVPDSLIHQWLVELLRRFDLPFSVYDEERCRAIEESEPGNPFAQDQLVLASQDFLLQNPAREAQVIATPWDVLVVDEAHRLEWTHKQTSPAYAMVEKLASKTGAVLLLSATPEQMGEEGHFARLRLLDPARFSNLEAYLKQKQNYLRLSPLVDALDSEDALSTGQKKELAKLVDLSDELADSLDDPQQRQQVLDLLVDRHGTSRIMYRNTRAAIGNFPMRVLHAHTLDADAEQGENLRTEFGDPEFTPNFDSDPRQRMLLELLAEYPEDKFLLICTSRAKVDALAESLRQNANLPLARFHQDMSLIQRDRNAAYFAETDGARLLICSEIGSEGRNFQFARHLVLLDLPDNPDLLEQRIGRLDRIGQTRDIHIHVPVIDGSPQQFLFEWFHQGLDAFQKSRFGSSRALMERFGDKVLSLAAAKPAANVVKARTLLIKETQTARDAQDALLHSSRDKLLELNTRPAPQVADMIRRIENQDDDIGLERLAERLFDHYGVNMEPHGLARTYILNQDQMTVEQLPGLRDGLKTVTFDRQVALSREEFAFLRSEHPLILGAMELLLGSDDGGASIAWSPEISGTGWVLAATYVLQPGQALDLHPQRFFPPQPMRLWIGDGPKMLSGPAEEITRFHNARMVAQKLGPFLEKELPERIEMAEAEAAGMAQGLIDAGLLSLEESMAAEVARLEHLMAVGNGVSQQDIARRQEEKEALSTAISAIRPRLDSLCVILGADFGHL